MADELDPRLEAKLRAALRSEADALPLLVRPEDVDRRRNARRRRPLAVAASLLSVAAVLAILVGTGAIGRLLPPGPGASPSPTARPLESFATLVALLSPGDTPLLQGEQISATDPGPSQGAVDLGVLPPAVHLKFALQCLGGSLDIVIRHGNTDLGTHHTDCALRPFVVQTPDPTLFGHAPYDGTEHVVVMAAGGVRWRIVVAATLEPGPSFILVEPSATPSLNPEGCAQIRQPSQARSFIVKNIAAGIDYGDVALRVEPGSWPIADLAPLAADSQGALGFDVRSHCVRTWDLSFASLRDVQAALDAGTQPQLAAGPLTTASDNHSLRVFGLPVGDLVVRVIVTWDTVAGLDLTDVYLLHLTVLPPVPSASGVPGHPDPTVPCVATDAATPAPPAPALYQDGARVGTGATWSSTWHGTADDGVPVVPEDVIDLALGTGLEVRIAGDACAKLWLVTNAPVPANRLLAETGAVLAQQGNPTLDPAFARENRIALADLPAGDWAVSVHLVFEGGGSNTLFHVRVGG